MNELRVAATPPPEVMPSRWTLIRDVAVFQLKLFLDGLRDAALIPISLVIAALDLLGIGPRPGRQFYLLLKLGRRTEYWINLFGAAKSGESLASPARPGVDALVDRLERVVVREYERGGITTATKDALDRALDGITGQGTRGPPPPPD